MSELQGKLQKLQELQKWYLIQGKVREAESVQSAFDFVTCLETFQTIDMKHVDVSEIAQNILALSEDKEG